MRATALLAAGMFAAAMPLAAQKPHAEAAQGTQEQSLPPVAKGLENAGPQLSGLSVPAASTFAKGDRTIAAHTTEQGPVSQAGTIRVAGTVDGDVFAYGGDIVLVGGGRVTGNAVAIDGHVILQGGEVEGETRATGGGLATIATVAPARTTQQNVALTLGWAGVVLLVGIGVLVFGGRTLDIVGETVDQKFGRSLAVGIAATVALMPLLGLLCIGLALTILGILLVPFAIVAYVLGVTGLVTLGFLAAMRVTGHSIGRSGRGLTDRGAALRALVIGVIFYLGLWLVAAVATPWPAVEWVARMIAFAVTWAAATVGLGATIISRAGTRPLERSSINISPLMQTPYERAALAVAPIPDWQTPTPVAGVVAAARRPSSAHKTV